MSKYHVIAEIFEEAATLTTKKAKIEFLRKHSCAPLKDIIRINFDSTIVSLLPKGAPPYKKDDMPSGHNYSSLHRKYRKFKYFFKGQYSSMNQSKRESIFIGILETINPRDAELLINAKDKNLKYKGITKALCKEAFPNLIVE